MEQLIIEKLKNLKEYKEKYEIKYVEKIKQFDEVMLWGTSESAVEAITFFKEHGISISAIYDDDPAKQNTNFYNIPVVKPVEAKICENKNVALVITISFYDVIKSRLEAFDKNISMRMFMFDGYFLENITPTYFFDNIAKICTNYNGFADEKSKNLYLSLLQYRYIRDADLLKNICEPHSSCYFDSVFLNAFKEGLIVDAGSYNADFVTKLASLKNVSHSHFYIFEPNANFLNKIANNLDENISHDLFQVALCDKETQMQFQQTNTSNSHLSHRKYNAYHDTLEFNEVMVQTNTLDNILENKKVCCVKIDIEGSEQAMIKGATRTIKRDRPILLLSVYHRCNDLWELQYYLNSLQIDYQFYLRHYSLCAAKSILYCIPVDKDYTRKMVKPFV